MNFVPQGRRDVIHSITGTIVVLGFFVLIGYCVRLCFWRPVDLLIDINISQRCAVSGSFAHRAEPVSTGSVAVVVIEARTARQLGSALLPLDERGHFGTNVLVSGNVEPDTVLFVKANAHGMTVSGKRADATAKMAINRGAAWVRPVFVWMSLLILILLVYVVFQFSGVITLRRLRDLFRVTYFITFLALAVPLLLILALPQDKRLMEMMRDSPVGLVQGSTQKGGKAQWLINIGGIPQMVSPVSRGGAPRDTSSAELDQYGRSSEVGMDTWLVEGGIAVPFYMVILALFGAGINMTRQVPRIQAEYSDYYDKCKEVAGCSEDEGWLRKAWQMLMPMSSKNRESPAGGKFKTDADIRREVVEIYMGAISAPFLGIAAYSLLQLISPEPGEPVLVIMGFGAGLVSDAFLRKIISEVETLLAVDKDSTEKKSETESSVESAPPPTAQLTPPTAQSPPLNTIQ